MGLPTDHAAPIGNTERLYIGGEWVPASSGSYFEVIDSATEECYFRVAEASRADVNRAVAAARRAFDDGPWPRLSHAQRASYLTSIAEGLRRRAGDLGDIWTRESGVLHRVARSAADGAAARFDRYAGYAATYPFEQAAAPTAGGNFGLLVREPVGVVGAIIPWNNALGLIAAKVAPALLAGCTVVLKLSPEAPGEGYVFADVAAAIGLPPGVLNIVTADREASEALVADGRVDKITFTGSTATGRRIASLCAERIARCTLELGGKSAAVVLDDADLDMVARRLVDAECLLTGQVCSSLTRIVVSSHRHDELVEAMAARCAEVLVGDPFDEATQMGPLATRVQRDRVEHHIARGVAEGARLVSGGGRPPHLPRGFYVEPTVFADVDNRSTIAQEEIFGPVLSVIRARDEADAVRIANDTIYGLNASVFTNDVDRARAVARDLRAGTVGHNAYRTDMGVAFGGFKQSGIGREGGIEGLLPFLETKFVILDEAPNGHVA